MNQQVTRWTVDYGDGRLKEVRIPHAWRQDVDVRWEGPATYSTLIDVPYRDTKLIFHGVSYLAEVHIDGHHVATHEGIWDAFEIDLEPFKGKRVSVQVRVTKNGGEKFPVKETLSGFLPYVYHTFGGIFRPVELGEGLKSKPVEQKLPLTEMMRGILHWGWYPELGHCHPNRDMIEKEIEYIRSLGFNTVKFCLWLPPHEYLELLLLKGMHAWIELPLWLPHGELYAKADIELDRIVRQYAHHPNVIAWTLGCELQNAPAEFRERWVKKIQTLTKCDWVKDNSGGAEMYGGDPREFGTFEDFHPYGEAQFFGPLLDSLRLGPRKAKPILLGETVDSDVHRDLAQIADTMPYWASAMRELNDQGVRWQYDIPKFLGNNRFAHEPEHSGHQDLMQKSIKKALFVRKHIVEQIRSRDDFEGYVLTGLRDTPISSSGILTDWARERYRPSDFLSFNGASCLFLIPQRDPRWTRGGNRAAYRDLYNFFEGESTLVKIGFRGLQQNSSAIWRLTNEFMHTIAEGIGEPVEVSSKPTEVLQAFLPALLPGTYRLHCEFGLTTNDWTIHIHQKPKFSEFYLVQPNDAFDGVEFGKSGIAVSTRWDEQTDAIHKSSEPLIFIKEGLGTVNKTYWRECIHEGEFDLPFEQALSVAPDQVIDADCLQLHGKNWLGLMNRVDTRTYEDHLIVARNNCTVITTLRPQGGLGSQPNGLASNVFGQVLLYKLAEFTR
jgi:hypothetical protein